MRPFQWHLNLIIAHLDWWQNPQNVLKGADLYPQEHNVQVFTDTSNIGWGAHLRFYQRTVVRSRKIIAQKRLEPKAVFLALKHFRLQCQNQTVLVATDNSTVVAYINKQGGTHSVEMCALLWRIMSWCHRFKISLRARHIPGCLNVIADSLYRSTQIQSTEWSLHPQVFQRICTKWFTPHHKLPLYVSSSRSKRMEHRCSKHKLVKPCSLCLPSNSSTSKSNTKGPPVQLPPYPVSPGLARHALVLGSGPSISRNCTSVACISKSTEAVKQPGVSQQSAIPQPPCLVSRSEQLQEQGFSSEVAERIAAPQRSSTRSIYQAKWALFEKWCRENLVDVSKPSIKQVSDFFMHLFQDLNRRPSNIDGYRTAILDYLGPTGLHIAQSTDLNRLLASFHRDKPKATRNIPKWNLSVVLNELTKKPFEPMKDSDIKHLTLKTAFLLALALGKCRSEIHAWVANKVSNLGQWEKVALFPSSDFIAKNQLAREGAQSVSPVIIPALIVDSR